MKIADVVTAVLLIIGGLNWGLVALAEFDLVAAIFGLSFGETNVVTRLVYALVGLSALYQAARLPAMQRRSVSRSSAGRV
ncbi:DUF378 domain-containing protein [Pseudonocardia cypriaca]|uniref:DUF378 domain-containing protein n=1 Tax=Pseudonocardia cypriaca TaxID=882449 RepID=A0A543FS22_9PSEU|nr:DUF378 domain-containing protein [Pseudonocardia cypriaca]TQM36636.1 hypothetical protein FB388_3818 [Pseudonocardia cypriaca]